MYASNNKDADYMSKQLAKFTTYAILIAMIGVMLYALISATIIWWVWPLSFPSIFPNLVQLGYLPLNITWLQAFTASWILHLIFAKPIMSTGK